MQASSRRSILKVLPLSALAVLIPASLKSSPQAAPHYRPYRVGESTLANRFVKVVHPRYLGRAVVVPSWTWNGDLEETSFVFAGKDTTGVADIAARYESGPKWWLA